jgi:hypothetical protein
VDLLNQRRLPLKIALDDIYPPRSMDFNAYYWGVVLKYISDESGHDIIECHEGYKQKFSLRIDFEFNTDKSIYEPVFGVGSTAEMNMRVFSDYVFRVRVDGELEHHIIIPFPSEVFIPELQFSNDNLKQMKL